MPALQPRSPAPCTPWDISTGVDGPGTRFVVFTAGCPLRCMYCHNPDTWSGRSGRRVNAASVLALAGRYRRFIAAAGGGLTVSGGEPLLQPAFTRAVLTGARELGLHTALDTSGYLGSRADNALLDATDLVLLDIKAHDPAIARLVTGRDSAPTLAFARLLAARHQPVWVRFVLVPGWTDDLEDVAAVAEFAAALGLTYPCGTAVPPTAGERLPPGPRGIHHRRPITLSTSEMSAAGHGQATPGRGS